MKTIHLLGIDLAKNVLQLHGTDSEGRCIFKKKLSRAKLFAFIANLPPCLIAMEACAGAHYFSRKFQQWGHETRLLAPQFVTPYVQGNKDDAADAEGISEAASRPRMRFVATKAVWQQDLQSVHRIRERLMSHRTAVINEARGLLYEYGIRIPQGPAAWKTHLKALLAEPVEELSEDLTPSTQAILQDLYSEYLSLEKRIALYERKLKELPTPENTAKRFEKIPGIGPLGASALAISLGEATQFDNGRHFAAYLGLVPRHRGTGGKNRIGRISKRGDRYLRSLLIHGGRSLLQSVIRRAAKGEKLNPFQQWIMRLYHKKGWNRTCVAIANKNARIAWAMKMKQQDFDVNQTVALAH